MSFEESLRYRISPLPNHWSEIIPFIHSKRRHVQAFVWYSLHFVCSSACDMWSKYYSLFGGILVAVCLCACVPVCLCVLRNKLQACAICVKATSKACVRHRPTTIHPLVLLACYAKKYFHVYKVCWCSFWCGLACADTQMCNRRCSWCIYTSNVHAFRPLCAMIKLS